LSLLDLLLLLLLLLQINQAFSERRKMMRNTLQPLYTPQQVRPVACSRWTSGAVYCTAC
jgi:16S rRNA A1518/A1519 N6-dimethyltransferase RsmA/KsgA/DIM1 with predicted DNA glycosylase/AP lyase activity